MSNPTSPPSNPSNPGDGAKTPDGKPMTAEGELNVRIGLLQGQIKDLERDIRIDRGRISNRDPMLAKRLAKENAELRARVAVLQRALHGLLIDAGKPRLAADERQQHEILRQAVVEFCQQHNIDPEIWKSLES